MKGHLAMRTPSGANRSAGGSVGHLGTPLREAAVACPLLNSPDCMFGSLEGEPCGKEATTAFAEAFLYAAATVLLVKRLGRTR